jgi:hypothetical protein
MPKFLRLALMAAAGLLIVPALSADNAATAEPPMKIVPAPGPVTLDGTLAGWNLDGKLGPATFDPDSIDDYNATCYAMWDATYFYLAAVVVEPHPPYNAYPLKGVGAWNADDVIIRLSTNPARKWPIEGSPDSLKNDPDLFQGDLWYNHVNKKTYEDGYHGMGGAMLPDAAWEGAQVAVRLAADGKGYTETIRLPWKTLNPNFQPKAGDRIAFTWDICIGNANPGEPGRIFEIYLNGGGTDAFRTPTIWGQAVFTGPGGS